MLEEIDGDGIIRYDGEWTDSSFINEDLPVLELLKLVLGKWSVPRRLSIETSAIQTRHSPRHFRFCAKGERENTEDAFAHVYVFDVHQSWIRGPFLHSFVDKWRLSRWLSAVEEKEILWLNSIVSENNAVVCLLQGVCEGVGEGEKPFAQLLLAEWAPYMGAPSLGRYNSFGSRFALVDVRASAPTNRMWAQSETGLPDWIGLDSEAKSTSRSQSQQNEDRDRKTFVQLRHDADCSLDRLFTEYGRTVSLRDETRRESCNDDEYRKT